MEPYSCGEEIDNPDRMRSSDDTRSGLLLCPVSGWGAFSEWSHPFCRGCAADRPNGEDEGWLFRFIELLRGGSFYPGKWGHRFGAYSVLFENNSNRSSERKEGSDAQSLPV